MQVSRPAVSIVVPLYNKASYILRCLKSIQRQTFTDFEVIVVNDGSTDGSGDLAAGLRDPRFTVTHQDNQGSGAARNRGIALAQAGLIAFLDADDTWDENFLAAIAGLAKEFPEAGVFASGYRRCFGRGLDREVTLRTPPGTHTRLLADYLSIGRRGGCQLLRLQFGEDEGVDRRSDLVFVFYGGDARLDWFAERPPVAGFRGDGGCFAGLLRGVHLFLGESALLDVGPDKLLIGGAELTAHRHFVGFDHFP